MNRLRDESGATAVVLAIVLIVIVGVLALSVDGGLLWVKYRRIRNANDAASLAAALSCAKGDGQVAADASADAVAIANVSDAMALEANAYTPSCNPSGGKVHVGYGGTQDLMFGPAVGVSSPRDVAGTATAVWGGAGGSEDVVPLVLMKDRLSTCNVIPEPGKPTPPIGTECGFWWDDSALGSASWGMMALSTWGTTSDPSGCSAGGGVSDITNAITNGIDEGLVMNPGAPDVPTYVCAKNGNSVNPVDNAIRTALASGRTDFAMPVTNPSMQVNVSGAPYKYAIIAFAFVRPVDIYEGNKRGDEAGFAKCAGAIPPGADIRGSFCLVVTWQGYSYTGLAPGGGPNFGLAAVGLSE
jgi:putative Flp pilus-assembly TadE/G-like protein